MSRPVMRGNHPLTTYACTFLQLIPVFIRSRFHPLNLARCVRHDQGRNTALTSVNTSAWLSLSKEYA